MKVLIVSEMSIPYAVGGGEVRYGLLAKELFRCGHDVTWLSMQQRDSPYEEVIDGVRHLHRGPRVKSPPTRSLISMLHFMFAAFVHILTHRYDVIDTQTYAPLPMVWLACFLSRQKLVATIHATIHPAPRDAKTKMNRVRFCRLTNIVELFVYRLPYSSIITVSASTANALRYVWRVNPARLHVIHNGIELPQGTRSDSTCNRDIDLIYAGRLVAIKNIEDLVEAVRICRNAGVLRRAMFVGDGPHMEAVRQMATNAGMLDVIEFAGRKDNRYVIELLSRAKVFFHASSHEGFPVVMVEALACGTPVVAYRVAGVEDVVENDKTGILVADRDVEALAKACIRLLTSCDIRMRMASAGRTVVAESLTLDKMALRVIDVYEGQ